MKSTESIGGKAWAQVTTVVRRPSARPLVRFFTRLHSRMYRLTGGRAQAPAFPTLLLDVAGRKSGTIRTTPLVYVVDDGDFIVAAAYSGADSHPSWWVNLRSAGTATVQVGKRRVSVSATEALGEERERLRSMLCQMYPPFLDYVTRTERQFPVVRLMP